jgi:hypothetical protein
VTFGPPVAAPPESLAPPHQAKEKAWLRKAVMEWLRVMLIKSDMPSQTVCKEARRCGYSESTLRRAREELKVRTFRDPGGPNGVSWWTLRPQDTPDVDPEVEMSQIQNWEPESPGCVVPPNDPDGPQKSHGRRSAEHLLGLNGNKKKATKRRPGEEGVGEELAEAAPGEGINEPKNTPPPAGKKAEPHGEDLLGILQALRQDFEAERRVFDKWDKEDEEKKKRRQEKKAAKGKTTRCEQVSK